MSRSPRSRSRPMCAVFSPSATAAVHCRPAAYFLAWIGPLTEKSPVSAVCLPATRNGGEGVIKTGLEKRQLKDRRGNRQEAKKTGFLRIKTTLCKSGLSCFYDGDGTRQAKPGQGRGNVLWPAKREWGWMSKAK